MYTEDLRGLTLRLCGQSEDLLRSSNTLFSFYLRTWHWNVSCMYICAPCTYRVHRSQKNASDPQNVINGSETSSGMWEANHSPLDEQPML